MRSSGPASVTLREFSWSMTPSRDLLAEIWNLRSSTLSATSYRQTYLDAPPATKGGPEVCQLDSPGVAFA